jgi:hypothetical protein
MNTKELYQQLRERIANGESRTEVYRSLSPQGGEALTAKLLATIASPDVQARFKKQNTALAALLVFLGLIKLLSMPFPISLLGVLVPFGLAWEVYQWKGYIYRIVGMLAVVNGLRELLDAFQSPGGFFLTLIVLVPVAAVASLSFNIVSKAFPDLRLFGKVVTPETAQ